MPVWLLGYVKIKCRLGLDLGLEREFGDCEGLHCSMEALKLNAHWVRALY